MVSWVRALGACVIGLVGLGLVLSAQSEPPDAAQTARSAYYHTRARLADDEAAFRVHRPAYSFWRHIFTIPDGSIIYGSAEDGRLLATFPSRGNWARDVVWGEERLVGTVEGRRFSRRLRDRRDEVEALKWMLLARNSYDKPQMDQELLRYARPLTESEILEARSRARLWAKNWLKED